MNWKWLGVLGLFIQNLLIFGIAGRTLIMVVRQRHENHEPDKTSVRKLTILIFTGTLELLAIALAVNALLRHG